MASSEYLTIKGTGNGEYEEKKSRFLGEAIAVSSEEEAAAHVARIREKSRLTTENLPALQGSRS